MQLVVFHLFGTPAIGLAYGLLHGIGDDVGVHYDEAVDVAGRAPGCLRKGAPGTQEALLVGVEDGHQRYRRDIEALAQQVHAHEDVEQAVLEVFDDLHALGGVHVGVDVAAADAYLGEILVQFLCHSLGQRGDEHPLVPLGPRAYLLDEVVDLVLYGPDLDGRVKQACGTHDLLNDQAFGLAQFIVGRRGAYIYLLACYGFELVEGERAVVRRGRQAEAILDQYGLAGMVSAEHRVYLRERHVALVDEGDEVVREIIDEAEWPLAGLPPVEIAGIVLDAGTVAHLLYHLEVIFDALFQPLGFQVLAYAFEIVQLDLQVILDVADRGNAALLGGHEVVCRIDGDLVDLLDPCARHRVYDGDAVHLVPEEFDAYGVVRAA